MTLSLATRWSSSVASLVEFIKDRYAVSLRTNLWRSCDLPGRHAHTPRGGCDAPSLGGLPWTRRWRGLWSQGHWSAVSATFVEGDHCDDDAGHVLSAEGQIAGAPRRPKLKAIYYEAASEAYSLRRSLRGTAWAPQRSL